MTFPRNNSKKRFRILAIDGGGVRGILPSTIISRLQELTGRHPTELFDLMIGTSTGSIIVSVLNIRGDDDKPKYNSDRLIDVYLNECPKVFSNSTWKNFTSVYGIYGGRFSTSVRDQLFQEWLGDIRLRDTIGDIIIPSFDLCSKQPVFFKTRKARLDDDDNITLQDAVKAALAAPSVFCPYKIGDRLYMDALYGKNPTMFGIIEALKHYNIGLEDIDVLSIGTGYSDKGDIVETVQRTVQSGLSFLMEAFNSTINGNTKSTDYMASQLLNSRPDQCMRIDFFLEDIHMGICDVTPFNLSHLHKQANDFIENNMERVLEFCKCIVPYDSDKVVLDLRLEEYRAALVPLPEERFDV